MVNIFLHMYEYFPVNNRLARFNSQESLRSQLSDANEFCNTPRAAGEKLLAHCAELSLAL